MFWNEPLTSIFRPQKNQTQKIKELKKIVAVTFVPTFFSGFSTGKLTPNLGHNVNVKFLRWLRNLRSSLKWQ